MSAVLWIGVLLALPILEPGQRHASVEYWAVHTIATCSVLHTLLPPWDFLDPWPRAQKYYRAAIYVIGYLALHGRSTVYRSISEGSGPSPDEISPK
jgi:hypothetical protein